MIGRTILHYSITAKLGSGSFGHVYLAVDQHTGRRVALKFLDPTHCDLHWLVREARAVARLAHSGIVTLYSLEQDSGEWFLVEELVEGMTLEARLKKGCLDTPDAHRLAREVSAALAHAHTQGVLHRDLKPANILIATDGSYKITDFGIARIEGGSSSSSEGAALGTLPYTSPERIRGHKGDARADLFSLGAVLYEVITGDRAFGGSTHAAVLYEVMNVTPQIPQAADARLARLLDLVSRLLAKEPKDRPASAQLVTEHVDEIQRGISRAIPGRRGRVARIAALAGVVLVAIVILTVRLRSAPPAQGPIVVLPFYNVVEPADPQHLGVVASSFLTTTLAQASDVNVISTDHVLEQAHAKGDQANEIDPQVAREMARRSGAGLIIRGRILRLEPTPVMTAEVWRTSNGRVLGAAQIEGLPGQTIFRVVGLLGTRLIPELQGRTQHTQWQPPVGMDTLDLLTYQWYVEGIEYSVRGDYARAEGAFERALEREPGFSWARDRLAFTQWLRSQPAERESR